MSTQETHARDDLVAIIALADPYARVSEIADAVLAAGYEKRPDHVAEAAALRKQVEG